jgi:hypothetical protein
MHRLHHMHWEHVAALSAAAAITAVAVRLAGVYVLLSLVIAAMCLPVIARIGHVLYYRQCSIVHHNAVLHCCWIY